MGKLAQAIAHGATLLQVKGNFDDCLMLARQLSENYPVSLVNSVNPFRIEGQKTAAFELIEQLGSEQPLDALSIPVGNAGNITAYWKGFTESSDQLERLPRMLGFQAAGAALRNAAPLSDALRGEVSTLLAAAPGSLGQLVAAHATAQIVERAAQAERIAAALAHRNSKGATVATGPGLGATFWGDNAPGHEGLRRAGVARLLIAEGPSVDPRGVTRLGGLDAADAVRINLPAELMSEAQLILAIARGEACALLLASDAVAADGSAVLLAGGVALAAAAAMSAAS